MIKDEHQYKVTCYWAKRFQKAIDEFDDSPREGVSPRLIQATREGMESQLETLLNEIEEYKRLKADPTAKPKPKRKSKFDGAEALCELGKHLYSKGDLDDAISHFDEAIRIRPNLAEAWYNRGIAKGMKGEYDKAIADFDEAIRIRPDYEEAIQNRDAALKQKAEVQSASKTSLSTPSTSAI